MIKVLAPDGEHLFIYTGSVDVNIVLFFLVPCSASQGLFQAGREIFFLYAQVRFSRMNPNNSLSGNAEINQKLW